MISICSGWEYSEEWSEEFLRRGEGPATPVRLPHNGKELPLHYSSPRDYERICGYRRTLLLPKEAEGKRVFLQFDGAAHIAELFCCNGDALRPSIYCGYTAFRAEITKFVKCGEENRIALRLDCTENGEVPPFGFVIDYLTYGGLYREAWLDLREQDYIEDLFVYTPSLDRLEARVEYSPGPGCRWRLSVWDGEDCLLQETGGERFSLRLPQMRPWSPEEPKRYLARAELLDESGSVTDTQETLFGVRTVEFRPEGFFLNGKPSYLRGLNRHQCFPYIRYAASAILQREGARILKEELSCTAVRTSHYPPEPVFDECDRLGLMVFTEIPGWQHIGDEAWKDQAVRNVEEMVRQYRNHPSIVLWGVRINESQDDDAFYLRTNELCHRLDPSRPTSGGRYLQKSSLLEDVYAFNDFSHVGNNPGLAEKNR